MTSTQTAALGTQVGIFVAPTPELPDGRGPNKDIIPIAAIPVGGPLTLMVKTNVWLSPNNRDQIALDVTRTEPPADPSNTDFTRLPRVNLGDLVTRPVDFPITVPTEYLGEDATPVGPTPIWVRSVLYERGLNPLTSPVMKFLLTAPARGRRNLRKQVQIQGRSLALEQFRQPRFQMPPAIWMTHGRICQETQGDCR